MQIKNFIISIVLLLFIIFLIAEEKINNEKLHSDNLIGKNLFCEEHNLFITYSFLDSKRYQTTNYFLVYFDIGIRNGTYGYLNNSRYLYLKADKKLEIYNKSKKIKDRKYWKKKVVDSPKLDYYLDTKNLNILFNPSNYSEIKSKCEIFNGNYIELKEKTLKKYLRYFEWNIKN